MILTLRNKRTCYTDTEVVRGLQQRDGRMEEYFYNTAQKYFNEHFRDVFFDQDSKQEIFQTAFLKLWTEVNNDKISLRDNVICRQQKSGEYIPMTCSLMTFMMAFARNEFREMVRKVRENPYAEITETMLHDDDAVMIDGENPEAQKARIVDDCIQRMSPRCIEVLTLFYYEGKSLDEIMEIRGEKNTSKDGLKTAKNKCMNTLRERVSEHLRTIRI